MRVSGAGLERLKKFEALRLNAYKDVAGKWTIGYGHLILPDEQYLRSGPITAAKAESLLRADLATAERAVGTLVVMKLSQSQFDALVSFVFNVGAGAFARSDMLQLINAGNFNGAAAQFPRWTRAGGRQSAGLLARRAVEQNLFLS